MSSDLAQFDSAEAAREAYFNGEGPPEEEGPPEGWTEWYLIEEGDAWIIYGRDSTDPETEDSQFHATGELEDGSQVFLDRGGDVVDDMVVFDTIDELQEALEAYWQNVDDGDIPPGDQPTGGNPGAGDGDGRPAGGLPIANSTPGLRNFGVVGQLLILSAIAFAIWYYRNDGELEELPIVGDHVGGDNA